MIPGVREHIRHARLFFDGIIEYAGVVGGDARDDLASFWLRKTKRPVLAVLLVQKAGGKPQLYRGTNMEVRQ